MTTVLLPPHEVWVVLAAYNEARVIADVVALINASFDALCIAIKEHGGDIDKFIGDAIIAVFEDRLELVQQVRERRRGGVLQ